MSETAELIGRKLLARRAVQFIGVGRLPLYDFGPIWAGSGSQTECCLCGLAVDAWQTRYIYPRSVQSMQFHVSCFLAWEDASSEVAPHHH